MTTDTGMANAMRSSVTFLTFDQLTAAYRASTTEYDVRWRVFLAAMAAAKHAAETGDGYDEARADANGAWEACKAQKAMTWALIDEITARTERGDYA